MWIIRQCGKNNGPQLSSAVRLENILRWDESAIEFSYMLLAEFFTKSGPVQSVSKFGVLYDGSFGKHLLPPMTPRSTGMALFAPLLGFLRLRNKTEREETMHKIFYDEESDLPVFPNRTLATELMSQAILCLQGGSMELRMFQEVKSEGGMPPYSEGYHVA